MKRATRFVWLAAALCALGSISACASGSSSGNRDQRNSRRGDYYGGSIHRNSFPETFGRGGPARVGRPGRYRY